jgi:hypothetical protein
MAVSLAGHRRAIHEARFQTLIRQNDAVGNLVEHWRQGLEAKSDMLHIAERPLRIFFTYFLM